MAEARHLPPGLARLAARGLQRFVFDPGLSWERQRARLARVEAAGARPDGLVVAEETFRGVACTRAAWPTSPPERILLHLHGGGYCVGSPRTSLGWAAAVAEQARVTAWLPDYRLAPEAPFPAALDDARSVWAALTGVTDPSRIVLSGDSAGAGLALALVAALRDAGAPRPAGVILISPWLDLTDDRLGSPELVARDPMLTPAWLAACATAYAGATRRDDPAISPLRGSLVGMPPLLVQAGADDVLAPDALRLAAGVEAAGGEVHLSLGNDLWHDFPLQTGMLAAADSGVRQAARFVERRLGPATASAPAAEAGPAAG